jgi:hypothetical protein
MSRAANAAASAATWDWQVGSVEESGARMGAVGVEAGADRGEQDGHHRLELGGVLPRHLDNSLVQRRELFGPG